MQIILTKAQFSAITRLFKSIPSTKLSLFDAQDKSLTVVVWNGKSYAIQTFDAVNVITPGSIKVAWDKEIKPQTDFIELLVQGSKLRLFELSDDTRSQEFVLPTFAISYLSEVFKLPGLEDLEFRAIKFKSQLLEALSDALSDFITYQSGYWYIASPSAYIARFEARFELDSTFTLNKATFKKLQKIKHLRIALKNNFLWCINHDKEGNQLETIGYPVEATAISFTQILSQFDPESYPSPIDFNNSDSFKEHLSGARFDFTSSQDSKDYVAEKLLDSTRRFDIPDSITNLTDKFYLYNLESHSLVQLSNLTLELIIFPQYR